MWCIYKHADKTLMLIKQNKQKIRNKVENEENTLHKLLTHTFVHIHTYTHIHTQCMHTHIYAYTHI